MAGTKRVAQSLFCTLCWWAAISIASRPWVKLGHWAKKTTSPRRIQCSQETAEAGGAGSKEDWGSNGDTIPNGWHATKWSPGEKFHSDIASSFPLYAQHSSLPASKSQDWKCRAFSRFSSLPDIRAIIDCTEIFIETPKDPTLQNVTWSNYKHHNTAKLLVAYAPNSGIIFLSTVYGGKHSDKEITLHSGFLDKCDPYDMIQADKGFNISD